MVEAILDLLTEGEAQPTAQAVSARSGVSIRSIFRRFQDMEALHVAAIQRQTERLTELVADIGAEGSVRDRIGALVANRATVFESIAPVRRHGLRLAPGSAPIRDGLRQADRFFRKQVEAVFGPELASRNDAVGLLEALDAASSWEMWDRLRTHQHLSVTRARRTLERMLAALLASVEVPA